MNPAFSHQGITVITYLPTGNVLTLESVLYGLAAACMLAETLLWFRIMCGILTTDKIVYLFGKGFPVLGLMLSMILSFLVSLFVKRYMVKEVLPSIPYPLPFILSAISTASTMDN